MSKLEYKFAEDWCNKLKDYWFNKEIEKAVSLFEKTTFYQETPFFKTIHNYRRNKSRMATC